MSISLRRLFVRTAAAAFADRAQSAAILAASILFVTLDGPAHAQVTGTTTRLTTNPAPQLDPAISGDIVVYTDQRNGNDDVYYVRISDLAEVRVTNDSTAQRLNDIDDGVTR
jgi:beta propeller repeat protein